MNSKQRRKAKRIVMVHIPSIVKALHGMASLVDSEPPEVAKQQLVLCAERLENLYIRARA